MSDDGLMMLASEVRALRDRVAHLERLESPRRVAARATSAGGQSIPDVTATTINYSTVEFDDLSCITTGGSWQFRCPIAGVYHVRAALMFGFTTTWAPGEYATLYLARNGTAVDALDRVDSLPSGSSVFAFLGGSDLVNCAAGDVLSVKVGQGSGGSLATYNGSDAATYNYVAIHRVR